MLYCAFLHEKAKKYTLHLIRFLCQIAFFTIPGQKDSHAWREFGQGRKRPDRKAHMRRRSRRMGKRQPHHNVHKLMHRQR